MSTDREIVEPKLGFPFDEYVRALSLLSSQGHALSHLAELAAHFRANPDHDFVPGPDALAVFALVSEKGLLMAQSCMSPDEIESRQRDVASRHEGIVAAFPHLAGRPDANGVQ